jgi:predicted transcriptional regulator
MKESIAELLGLSQQAPSITSSKKKGGITKKKADTVKAEELLTTLRSLNA